MITGFNHSGFVVRDVDAMIRFYRDTLGLTVLREVDSLAPPGGDHTGILGAPRFLVFVGKAAGDHALELVHYIQPPSPAGHLDRNQLGAAHVAFNVEETLKLAADAAAAETTYEEATTAAGRSQGEEFIARAEMVRQLQKNEGALQSMFPGQKARVRTFFRARPKKKTEGGETK